MNITKGVTVGPYEILAHIGAGGMGEVWRARDKRIGRDVAVKVLPESFSAGDERVRRFEQEARAAGALNHPGLVTIFDVGTTDGSPYIVMELLEGETLRDAIGEVMSAPLPLRKAIDYAIQIASALSVAHEKGIIHRDLKPENLFITSDGRVKILDFGLAKLAEDATDVDGRHRTARHLTSAGMVVGTPGYMSPEQVRAKPLDYRTDIFSFGAVLYEMLCGHRAFDQVSAAETMNAVANDDPPPLTSIEPTVPAALDAIVRHCIEKNPRERFQSARDLAFQLRMLPDYQNSQTDSLKPLPGSIPAAKPVTLLPYRAAIAVLAVAALAAAGFALFRFRGGGGKPIPRTFTQLTFGNGVKMFPALSSDGKTFAYVSSESGNRDIYVQRVDGRGAINITSDSPVDDSEPAFSPNGSQIAFRSERDGGGIFVMGVTGESVIRLSNFGHNPSWSPDGRRIVIATEDIEEGPDSGPLRSELWIVDTRTGVKRPLLQAPAGNAVQPNWSPHGKRIAYWTASTSGQRDIRTIDPDAPQPGQTIVAVTSDPAVDWNPVWSSDGTYLLFGSDRDGTMNLWRVPIDEETGKPSGTPEPLSLPAAASAHFTISQHDEIAYESIVRSYRVIALPIDPKGGPAGAPRTLLNGSQIVLSFKVSPNGRSIAFATGGPQESVFVADADGTHLRQLTNDLDKDRGVTWSPDGKTLYFYSNRSGAYHIWSIQVDGGGLTRVTDDDDYRRLGAKNAFVPDVSPDGRTLAVQTDRFPALVHLDRPHGQRMEGLDTGNGPSSGAFPTWSPDGKLLLAVLAPAGFGVYSLQTHRFETVSDRGTSPRWFSDSRHVAFLDKEGIEILDLDTHEMKITPLASLPELRVTDNFELSKDGSTLFALQALKQGDIWMMRRAKETP